ncbi:MAG: ribosome-associated translation inhibitor RaiA [Bacilli bacterium]|nr:ribosome-associated translation inhibitor RaiA [Bacilli bacterium]
MKYNIRGNKIEVTDSIKDYLEEKLSKIEKYFDDEGAEVKAVISTKGKDQKIEVTIWSGKYNIRVEEKNDDLYAAIDLIVDKIERQIRKFKTKVISKRVKDIPEAEMFFEEDLDTQNDLKVVRRKELFLKPIDEEEAITQMELLGHSFFVFKDVDSNKTCVIYKRKDGDYGLIEVN